MSNTRDVLLVLFAVTTSTVAVYRMLPTAPVRPVGLQLSLPVEEIHATADSSGFSTTPPNLLVFTDYECPACQQFDDVVRELIADHPEVRIVYRHFPLERIHFQAFEAATFAECAREQGRFGQAHERLMAIDFDRNREWPREIAEYSGITDSAALEACVAGQAGKERVRNDMALGARLGVRGTPAIVIGQELFVGALTRRQLEALLF